ncbi:MAG: PKD domain-containing protein, partial [Chitinophagales bacterium]
DYTVAANLVTFNNLSVDASDYSWTFGDGATSALTEPNHMFAEIGPYIVCLNATNVYGDDQNCKTIEITQITNIEDKDFINKINVYPTLTSGAVNIDISGLNDAVVVEIFNTVGEKLFEKEITSPHELLNISNFAPGEYLLRCKSHSAVAIKRISLIN